MQTAGGIGGDALKSAVDAVRHILNECAPADVIVPALCSPSTGRYVDLARFLEETGQHERLVDRLAETNSTDAMTVSALLGARREKLSGQCPRVNDVDGDICAISDIKALTNLFSGTPYTSWPVARSAFAILESVVFRDPLAAHRFRRDAFEVGMSNVGKLLQRPGTLGNAEDDLGRVLEAFLFGSPSSLFTWYVTEWRSDAEARLVMCLYTGAAERNELVNLQARVRSACSAVGAPDQRDCLTAQDEQFQTRLTAARSVARNEPELLEQLAGIEHQWPSAAPQARQAALKAWSGTANPAILHEVRAALDVDRHEN